MHASNASYVDDMIRGIDVCCKDGFLFFSFENGRIIYHDRLEIGESRCFTNYIMRHNLLVSSVYHHIQLCVASHYGMCFDKMNIVKAHEHLQQLL